MLIAVTSERLRVALQYRWPPSSALVGAFCQVPLTYVNVFWPELPSLRVSHHYLDFPSGLRDMALLKASFISFTEPGVTTVSSYSLSIGLTFFPSLHFATDTPVEANLVLHVSCQIGLQVGFGFYKPIPEHSDSVSIFLLGDMTVLPPLICFLFMLEFCQEAPCSSLQAPVSFAWLPACVNTPFFSLEVIFKNQPALLRRFLSRELYPMRLLKVGHWTGQSLFFWSLELWSCFCLAPFFQVPELHLSN